jgi:alpha,alpha-trehalase
VPNGNRSYYLSRSQPFFSSMVKPIGPADGDGAEAGHLSQLQRERDFRTEGAHKLPPDEAGRNSVRLSDGTLLNRYWDARDPQRDESYKEDVETAAGSGRPPGLAYRTAWPRRDPCLPAAADCRTEGVLITHLCPVAEGGGVVNTLLSSI